MPICEFCDQEYTNKVRHQKTEKCLRAKKLKEEKENEEEKNEEVKIEEEVKKEEEIKKEEIKEEETHNEEIDVGEAITNLENNIISIKDGMKDNMKQLYDKIKSEMLELLKPNKQDDSAIKILKEQVKQLEFENTQIRNQMNQYKNEIKTEILKIKVNKPQPVLKLEYKKYESPKKTKY